MRHLYLFIIVVFVLAGCTQKNVDLEPTKKPEQSNKNQVITKSSESSQEAFEEEHSVEQNFEVVDEKQNKIAVIYPSKVVGKYAKLTLSTISAYLIYNNQNFELETFDSYNETPSNINEQVNLLKEKGFSKVIALFTQNGFEILNSLEQTDDMKIYFPLVNKTEIFNAKENFIFGGISYSDQINLLNEVSNDRTSMFYVKSYVGNKLRDIYLQTFEPASIVKEVQRNRNNYKRLVDDKRLTGRMVMLNTPIVKSAIIMSQLTAFEIEPTIILSTQLNYNRDLISLTQYRDRKNFFIASSIAHVESFLEEYISLLGADVSFNWVDYSSLVGINYLLKENESMRIPTKIIDNQASYETILYRSTSYGFEKALEK